MATPNNGTADVENVIIPELTILPSPSAAKAITNDRWFVIPPESQENFTYESNDTISFRFGSNHEFVNFAMSYITFDFTIDDLAQVEKPPSLEVGGMHSLFRSIRLSTVNGDVDIELDDQYNRNYIRKSMMFDDAFDISVNATPWFDDTHRVLGSSLGSNLPANLHNISHNGVADTETRLNLSNGKQPLQIGDMIIIDGDVNIGTGQRMITYIDANNNFAYFSGPPITPLLVAGTFTIIPQGRHASLRTQCFTTYRPDGGPAAIDRIRKYRVTLVPRLEWFKRMFPLMLVLGGVRLELQLEKGDRAFISNAPPNHALTGNTYTYTISKPRLHLRYVTPHASIRNVLRQQFDSQKGLEVSMLGTRVRVTTTDGTATDANIVVHPGLRSVRSVMVQLQDSSLSDGVGALVKASPSLSHGLRSGIYEYNFSVGAMRFPDADVESEPFGSTSLMHFNYLSDRLMPDNPHAHRFHPKDWWPNAVYWNQAAGDGVSDLPESLYYYYCMDFSRTYEPLGYLTGIDTTAVPLIFNIRRKEAYHTISSMPGNIRYRFFFTYDRLVTLSSKSGVTTSE